MDGLNTRNMKRLMPHQVKRLPLGSIVVIYDEENSLLTQCRLIQYGKEKRLQSLKNLGLFFRIKDNPGQAYLVD